MHFRVSPALGTPRLVLIALSALAFSACSQDHPVQNRPVASGSTRAEAAGPHDQASTPATAQVQAAPFDEPTIPFPQALFGLWAVSPDVCQSPDGEGRIRITANLLTGYEVALRPLEVKSVGASAWTIESEENYLGTQFAKVIQTISLDGGALIVQPEGEQVERYLRCGE
ncbi:hypothetical protein [Lysobacter fragariae]